MPCTVFVNGRGVVHETSGDEAGSAGGVLSGVVGGEAEFSMYSFDVKFEGRNVCRLGDPLLHNKKNAVG